MLKTVNSENDLIEGVLKFGPDILEHCLCSDDLIQYVDRIREEHLNYPIPPSSINPLNWFIPEEYQTMDIEEYLINHCPEQNYDRVVQELDLYRKNNLIILLKTMKYIVDILRANNIVWGVGRGSSVASYVLYLIGVHKVDSVKYNLPIEEFFKEI
jgi:DNA polymerase III alpha subunit